jgi:hypothetical protein
MVTDVADAPIEGWTSIPYVDPGLGRTGGYDACAARPAFVALVPLIP